MASCGPASYGPTVCTSNVTAMEPHSMEPHSPAAPKSPINNNNTNQSPIKAPPGYHLPQHVNFKQPADREMEKEKKHKYLTAKYGGHQMMLIRKRLAVEDWIYEALRTLYHCVNDSDDHSSEFDLEELLDFDEDNERRQYAMEKLSDAKQTAQEVHIFIEEVLKKAKTL